MSRKDKNYKSYADVSDMEILDQEICPHEPLEYSDILKFSNAQNMLAKNLKVCGGKEDVIDINRKCNNILIINCLLSGNGKYIFTIKDSTNITIKDCVIDRAGKDFDIEIGNYSTTGSTKVINVVLDNVTRTDGKPIKVNVLNGNKPVLVNGTKAKITVVWPIFWKIYFFLRGKNIIK